MEQVLHPTALKHEIKIRIQLRHYFMGLSVPSYVAQLFGIEKVVVGGNTYEGSAILPLIMYLLRPPITS